MGWRLNVNARWIRSTRVRWGNGTRVDVGIEWNERRRSRRATGRWATRNIGVPLIIKEPFAVAPMPTDVE